MIINLKKITIFLIKILNDIYKTKSFEKNEDTKTKNIFQIFSTEKKIAVNYFSSKNNSQDILYNFSEVIKNIENNKKFNTILFVNYIETTSEISDFIDNANKNTKLKIIFWDKNILNKYLKIYNNYLPNENYLSQEIPYSITPTFKSQNTNSSIFKTTFLRLNDFFFKKEKDICVIFSSIYGTGKTSLANDYASKNTDIFNHTAYIKIHNDFRIDFINGFTNSVLKFQYDKSNDFFANYNKLLEDLKKINGQNLLIIDSIKTVQHIAIIKNIAKKIGWKILIISETKLIDFNNIEIQTPSKPDIFDILKTYISDKNAEIIANILQKTENNLFLTHFIGKQLKSQKKLSIKKIQQIFLDKDEKVHYLNKYINAKISIKNANLQKRIYKYVLGIYEYQVQNFSRSQKNILTNLICLPLSYFAFDDLEKLLQITDKKKDNFVNDLLELKEHGWIEIIDNSIFINQTIKHILHKKLKPDSRSITKVLEIVNSKLENYEETNFLKYIPIGLSIISNITIASESIINLSEFLGKVMNFLAFNEKAANHYNFAGEILENLFNFDNPNDSDLQRLSSLFLLANDFEKALYYGQSNAEFMIQKYGNNSEQTADAYRILSIIHQYLEDIDNAIYYIDYALDIYEQLFNKKHPSRQIATEIHTNLSKLYKSKESFNSQKKFIDNFFKKE